MKRSNLELWLIVQDNFDKYFEIGLCGVVWCLLEVKLISYEEKSILLNDIHNYAKKRFNFNYQDFFIRYIWERGHKKPRKMFIQKQILKAKKNEN